jgi:hypothetical protein
MSSTTEGEKANVSLEDPDPDLFARSDPDKIFSRRFKRI